MTDGPQSTQHKYFMWANISRGRGQNGGTEQTSQVYEVNKRSGNADKIDWHRINPDKTGMLDMFQAKGPHGQFPTLSG